MIHVWRYFASMSRRGVHLLIASDLRFSRRILGLARRHNALVLSLDKLLMDLCA